MQRAGTVKQCTAKTDQLVACNVDKNRIKHIQLCIDCIIGEILKNFEVVKSLLNFF